MSETYLEIKDIELMENAAGCSRDRLLIGMLFHLAGRISEILGIAVDDIDFANGLINIVHLKTGSRLLCPDCQARISKSYCYCPKCGSKIDKAELQQLERPKFRKITLNKETLALLMDFIEHGGPVFKNGDKYLFNINRHRGWQIVKDCAERAGLPDLINPDTGRTSGISPHRLRDAFAVHAMKLNDSGDGLRLLQEYLGHANFDTTAKYRKVAGKELKDWYNKLWNDRYNPDGIKSA